MFCSFGLVRCPSILSQLKLCKKAHHEALWSSVASLVSTMRRLAVPWELDPYLFLNLTRSYC